MNNLKYTKLRGEGLIKAKGGEQIYYMDGDYLVSLDGGATEFLVANEEFDSVYKQKKEIDE